MTMDLSIRVAFNAIDKLIADIAVVFHWPPSEMYGMELRELMAWRQRAAI
ncbi:hypothetical protein CQA18_26045, partial [Enterobacter hormaechei]